MTRLSSVLYQYVLEHSEAFLALMPEYPDCRRFSDEKEAALRAALSPEACIILDDLLRERALQHVRNILQILSANFRRFILNFDFTLLLITPSKRHKKRAQRLKR